MLAESENRRKISRFCQIPASSGAFFLSAFSFTQIPLFPRNPFFPASDPATGSSNGPHAKAIS